MVHVDQGQFRAMSKRPVAGDVAAQTMSSSSWYAQGEAHAEAERYRQALRCFEEALILDPTHAEALLYQVVCLLHLNQPQQALAVSETLLALAPNHSQGWLFHGVALHRLGRFKAAYASYDRAEVLAAAVS